MTLTQLEGDQGRTPLTYPLAGDGVFLTIQGEGALMGLPSIFVRLAGCSVGCRQCDTDYRVKRRATASEIAAEVMTFRDRATWIWLTGGEPGDQPNLFPLLDSLKCCGKVAIATSGSKHLGIIDRDFLSVSPHGKPEELVYTRGAQINLVPGLNGLQLSDWESFDASGFKYRYVTPCDGKPHAVEECLDWVYRHPEWRLGVQAHKTWGIA